MHEQKNFTIFALEILLMYQPTNWWLKNLLWSNKEADFFPDIKKSFTSPGMGHVSSNTLNQHWTFNQLDIILALFLWFPVVFSILCLPISFGNAVYKYTLLVNTHPDSSDQLRTPYVMQYCWNCCNLQYHGGTLKVHCSYSVAATLHAVAAA